jgi:hypothetical protein
MPRHRRTVTGRVADRKVILAARQRSASRPVARARSGFPTDHAIDLGRGMVAAGAPAEHLLIDRIRRS